MAAHPPERLLERLVGLGLARSHRADGIAAILDRHLGRAAEPRDQPEFVAVLSNQPQGGFITRKPTPAVEVADSSTWGGEGFGFFFQPGWNSQPQTSNTRQRGGQPYYPAQRGYPAQQGYSVQQGYPMQPGRW